MLKSPSNPLKPRTIA